MEYLKESAQGVLDSENEKVSEGRKKHFMWAVKTIFLTVCSTETPNLPFIFLYADKTNNHNKDHRTYQILLSTRQQ